MKSTFHKAGNFNLRSKKSRSLACGCCEVQNFKERELEREHIKQMQEEQDMS